MENFINQIRAIPEFEVYGHIDSIVGQSIIVRGLNNFVRIGDYCQINGDIGAEVIAINRDNIIIMPYGDVTGMKSGMKVSLKQDDGIYPDISWIGRVINAFVEPVDDKSFLVRGSKKYHLLNSPPNAYHRKRVGGKIITGVKAIDIFAPCCRGQRMGIFAGSGVGKSVMIAMCAKYAKVDIKVIGLIGERGREVQEFIKEYLGEEGLAHSIIIVATSDEPALARRRAAYLAMTVSEYFRDLGNHVLCIMDNITRFAMAQREIGLAAHEAIVPNGYTPSVFVQLPNLLERSGPGTIDQGDITGLFAVLVEGDNYQEPITDAVRGILDGHLILSRKIAEYRYPAIDILASLSRMVPMCNSEEENNIINQARRILSTYSDMEDMIKLGIYKYGTNEDIDLAIQLKPLLEDFIRQLPHEYEDFSIVFEKLCSILERC